MLEKTMKQILIKKLNAWIDSITDEDVRRAAQRDVIVTGGCFVSFLENNEPNDFDCYFRTKETVLKVANYYAKLWNDSHKGQKNKLGKSCNIMTLDCDNPSNEVLNYYNIKDLSESKAIAISNFDKGRVKMIFPSDGIAEDTKKLSSVETVQELDEIAIDKEIQKEKKEYFPVFISSNAITLSNDIQIIIRFYGEPDKIHDTFDFAHTKAYFDNGNQVVQVPKDVYECVINKTLRYTGSKYPVCSVFRLRKFIERGWKINAGQMLKMAMQISGLDLQDINTLEDQLIGVDSLYFMELIKQFKQQEASDKSFHLTTGYVESIIDKIF